VNVDLMPKQILCYMLCYILNLMLNLMLHFIIRRLIINFFKQLNCVNNYGFHHFRFME